MSLTLGLNTALSGLMTNQRGLDVIAQNVVNVNTKGYTRKVMSPESRILDGRGAGVQDGGVSRMVSEGLLKDIRRQSSKLGKLEIEQQFYPRIDDLFGEVGDNSSIAHKLNTMTQTFELLASDINKPASQWSTVQNSQDVADLLSSMTDQLQKLRLNADQEIEKVVGLVNEQLTNIHTLNQSIVKNAATGTGTSELEDKRDAALSTLAGYIDVQYFKRADGSMTIYTTSGQMLLDNQPQLLSYSANTTIEPWMSAAGGHFSKIAVEGGATDLTGDIVGGQLAAYIEMRDKVVPNMQASLDELAVQMKEKINQVHNRGTSLPNVKSRYEGTRVFADQASVVPNTTDTAATIQLGTTSIPPATHTSLAFAASGVTRYQNTITAAAGTPFAAASFAAGTTFSIYGAEDSANNGTYRVVTWNSTSQITVEKVNPPQTMQLQNTDDVVIATFDSNGNQLKQTTLDTIMQLDYSGSWGTTPGTGRASTDYAAQTSRADWSINQVSAHIEGWLKSQGYTNASVNLDSEGKMVMDVGDSTVSLAFRDQSATAGGSTAADATIAFDSDGDGATDQTIQGFSNFFGLNDYFVSSAKNSVYDSTIQSSSFVTSTSRTLSLSDNTGQLGSTISVPAGSTLQNIADKINRYGRTTESAPLASGNTSWAITSSVTFTVTDSSSTVFTPVTIASPATVTLEQIAGQLTQGTVTASVVDDGGSKRLRLVDSRGEALTMTVSGGNTASSDLGQILSMTQRQRVQASVVPEGAGSRLRIVQTDGSEMFVQSNLDGLGKNLLSDLGLQRGATRMAGTLDVRHDILTAPENISRGQMQWNSDNSTYFLSPGDNTAALAMAAQMTGKQNMNGAGDLAAGSYSMAEYAAASIGVVARQSSHSQEGFDYQTKLSQSLDFQNASYSGVNLDEEVSAMIDFQQAYSASAKVITVLQDMLETLTNMIR